MKRTTIVESKNFNGRWEYFSEQSVKPGERVLSDADYLLACRERFPEHKLRLKPVIPALEEK